MIFKIVEDYSKFVKDFLNNLRSFVNILEIFEGIRILYILYFNLENNRKIVLKSMFLSVLLISNYKIIFLDLE